MWSDIDPIQSVVRPEPITTREAAIEQACKESRGLINDSPYELCRVFEMLRIPVQRVLYCLEWFRKTPAIETGEFPRSVEEVTEAVMWLSNLNDAAIDSLLTGIYDHYNDEEARQVLGPDFFTAIRQGHGQATREFMAEELGENFPAPEVSNAG